MNTLNHIAVIPDGNRRWAKAHGLLPWQGHEEGMKRFREVSEAAFNAGIPYFTFWGGSQDNLSKRSPGEVAVLMRLFRDALLEELEKLELEKRQIKFRVIGKWQNYTDDKKLLETVAEVEARTAQFTEKCLTILFGYDGRTEMLEAITQLEQNKLPATSENLLSALWTAHLPPLDLVIRTGGEPHWSAGFMMWHAANAQLFFTPELWPDFSPEKLNEALEDFNSRERRFGK